MKWSIEALTVLAASCSAGEEGTAAKITGLPACTSLSSHSGQYSQHRPWLGGLVSSLSTLAGYRRYWCTDPAVRLGTTGTPVVRTGSGWNCFLSKPSGESCQPAVAYTQFMSPRVVSGLSRFPHPIKAFLTEDQDSWHRYVCPGGPAR